MTAEDPPKPAAQIWRLGREGTLIHSIPERSAAWLAERDPSAIFFYASLEGASHLTVTSETMAKVYKALGDIGLTEKQIINAITNMQNAGIYFREREDL